jgi:hypothetical protein
MNIFNLKSPFVKLILVGIVALAIGLLIPHKSLFLNKDLKNLQHENDSLYKAIDLRNKSISRYDSAFNLLQTKETFYLSEINKRDDYISTLEHQIDSINGLIENTDTTIIKIKKQGYEDINSVTNWNTTQRVIFFTNYFKSTSGN